MSQQKEMPVTTSSKEALNLFLNGEENFNNANAVEAKKLLSKAIELDENFAMAYLYMAFVGGPDTYKNNMDKALSLSDKVSAGERLKIQYYKAFGENNDSKEKEYANQLLQMYPEDKKVQLDVGLYYFNKRDFANALTYFNKAIKLDKNFAVVYNLIGYCRAGLNQNEEAEKAFKTYIDLKPDYANPRDSYGELLLKMGKIDEAIVQYKKAIELNPGFVGSIMGLGNCYVFKSDFETARKYYQEAYTKALYIYGKFQALYWIAVSYIYEGNTDKALKTYDDYRALAEKENMIHNIIDSYSKQSWIKTEIGQTEDGFDICKKAIALTKDSRLTPEQKEGYMFNCILWRLSYDISKNDFEKAKSKLDSCKQKLAINKDPGMEFWMNGLMGNWEFRLGNNDKALEWFFKSDMENPENWFQIANTYMKKGDKDNARKYYEKITSSTTNRIELAFVLKKASDELKKI
jgi:Tfp pilus assembly protein PilF